MSFYLPKVSILPEFAIIVSAFDANLGKKKDHCYGITMYFFKSVYFVLMLLKSVRKDRVRFFKRSKDTKVITKGRQANSKKEG